MKHPLITLVLVSLSFAGCDSSSDNADTTPRGPKASLEGYVYLVYDGSRMGNIDVSLLGTSHTVRADSAGRYKFTEIEPGNYTILLAKDGLAYDRDQSISLRSGDSLVRQLGLTPITGMWSVTVRWESTTSYTTPVQLRSNGGALLGPDNAYWPGEWTLIKDSLHMSFENGTYIGVVNDSISGVAIPGWGPQRGAFTAIR
jgi:hypothetical protein